MGSSLICAITFLGLQQAAFAPKQVLAEEMFRAFTVKLHSLLPGRELFSGAPLDGPPFEAAGAWPHSQRLYLRQGKHAFLVASRESLAGHVKIDSPQKALEFARIDVSWQTGENFIPRGTWTFEVMTQELAGDLDFWGTGATKHDPAQLHEGTAGLVKSATLEKLKLPRGNAWKDGPAYFVVQPLIRSIRGDSLLAKSALELGVRTLKLSPSGATLAESWESRPFPGSIRWSAGRGRH